MNSNKRDGDCVLIRITIMSDYELEKCVVLLAISFLTTAVMYMAACCAGIIVQSEARRQPVMIQSGLHGAPAPRAPRICQCISLWMSFSYTQLSSTCSREDFFARAVTPS
jgi:hypothetical protein